MKKFFAILAMAAFTLGASAQNEATEKYSVATNSFWSNWFVEVGADWNAWYSNEEWGLGLKNNPIKDFRSHVGASVAIGKWFTPGIGLRTKVDGIWGRTVISDKAETNKSKYWNAQEQVLFNLSNMICGYNPNRIWNAIPFLGAGVSRNMSYNSYAMVFSAGLKNTFRVTDRVGVNLELGYNFADPGYDGIEKRVTVDKKKATYWKSHDQRFYAEIGLTFNLGKVGWEKTPDVDAIKALYQSQIDALNGQLNDANGEIARLKNLLANQKPAATQTVKQVISAPVTVFYNIGKTEINSEKDLVNVKNFAEAAAANNAKVEVTGYADNSTGSAEINEQLAQGRAEALANKIAELGVSRDNISISSKGGVAEYSPVALDRRATAIMK